MTFAQVHIKALWWSYRFTGMVPELYLFVCLTFGHLVRYILACVVIRPMVNILALIVWVLRCLVGLTMLLLDIALHDPTLCLGCTFERGWIIVGVWRWALTTDSSDERQTQTGLIKRHYLLISCHIDWRHRVSFLVLGRQDFTSLKCWQVRLPVFALSALIEFQWH